MKTFKKLIAIVLSVLLVSTFALPVVSFAATVASEDHQTPDEFIDEKTDDDGEIIWTEISTGLFIPTFFVETVNTILSSLRAIFNQFLGFFATLIPDPDTFLPELPEEAPEDTSDLAEEVSELVAA